MSDAVQKIKDRLNIIDVVAPYVELHKAGRQFKGKSPFSNERTPSFHVSPERGMYYCFSTNQGGDIFTFIQVMEGVEFKEALKILAEKAQVELVPEAPEKRSKRDRYYAALTAATEFFVNQLSTATEAQEYLKQRGVKPETIAAWQIGYAPGPPHGGWRELRTHMQEQGFSDAELLAVGLIKQSAPGKDPFDVFRDRIMFPMPDAQGRVVAFSGRILHQNEKAPKYVNSPETELYKKSELLFGYHKAKHGIRKLPFWLIAEGQFDVIMSHQAGYTNSVAVSGTALTEHHVRSLERLCERVVLALDADRAGVAAMKKAAAVMLRRGLDVKIAALPEGKDPADMVVGDMQAYKRCIGDSTHIIEFLLQHLYTITPEDRTYKLRVREELLPFVLLIPNKIDQEHFIGLIAEQLHTTSDAVRHEVQRLEESIAVRELTEESEVPKSPVISSDNNVSLKTRSRKPDLVAYLVAALQVIDQEWRERVAAIIEAELETTITDIESIADQRRLQELTFVIERDFDQYNERQRAEEIVDRVNQLRALHIGEQLQVCKQKLQAAAQSGNEAEEQSQMAVLQTLQIRRTETPYDESAIRPNSELESLD